MNLLATNLPALMRSALRRAAPWLLACAGQMAVAGGTLPVPVSGQENAMLLSPYAQVLEDPAGTMTLDDVRAAASAWQGVQADALRFKLSSSAWWIRFTLESTAPAPIDLIVDLDSPRQDHVRWVVVRDDGHVLLDRTTGDRLPRATRAVDTRGMALPLSLAAGARAHLYVRLQSHDGLFESVGLRLSQHDVYFNDLRRQDILLSIYFGALLALGLYNLFLYLSTRAVEFAAYVVYSFSLLGWNLSYLGYSFEFLLPGLPATNHQLVLVSAGCAYAGIAWFILSYLRLDQTLPGSRAPRLYRWSIASTAVPIVLALADRYLAAVVAGLLCGMPLLVGSLVLSIRLSLQGRRDARFLAIAVGSLSLGAAAFYLELFGVVPNTVYTTFGIQIASFLEMLLLAFGLADSMNTLKAQKLLAEQQAHEAQRTLASDLERQVRERTRALEKANSMLGELAITDELTGAFNRRHFNQYCSEALHKPGRPEPMALCMLDIDHFKRYNDHYGHQAGDAVLRRVAQAVSAALRRSHDHLFRLGGEEFGVVFSAPNAGAAEQFVNSLRLAVRNLDIAHADSPLGTVTASFGVAWWPGPTGSRPTPEALYACADAALYEAKSAGRDRVVLRSMPTPSAEAVQAPGSLGDPTPATG